MSTLEFICPALTVEYQEPRRLAVEIITKLQNISI